MSMPRFRIEYLTETTEEESVCLVVTPDAASLDEAGDIAFRGFPHATSSKGAGGFQIRDMSVEHAPIVALETIDDLD
jgi:hypothetical protein